MRILFMGTPQFAVPSLESLIGEFEIVGVVTQPDRPAGRGKRLKAPPVKELALSRGIEVFQPERLREFKDTYEELNPDCVVVVAYGKILPRWFLDLPPKGVINLHASLLPKLRGSAPIQRALMGGERVTGNTVMLVSEEMDAGDMLSQEEIEIEEEDNFYTLSERLATKGARLLTETLKEWFEGNIVPTPQDHAKATYAPPIEREEFRICWKASAESVRDRIRGVFPNAYTNFRDNRIKILKARVVEGEGEPGEVLEEDRFVVACGENALLIEELISHKGRRVSGEEFLRGYRPERGELLK